MINIFFLVCFLFIPNLEAKSENNLQMNVAQLVVDEDFDYHEQLPKNFRTSKDAFKRMRQPMPSKEGLAQLSIAGSGQFSIRTLNNALKLLENKIWIVDLRRETHGFINEIPISWYALQNQSNLNMNSANLLKTENKLLSALANQSSLQVKQILKKENGQIIKTKQYLIDVKNARSEAAVASELGIGYLRLMVRDHHHPDDETVDQFLNFLKNLPPQATLYFHCRGGKGRSTLFMTMVDVLHNAKKVSLKDIVARQHLIGGVDLFSPSSEKYKQESTQARKQFILAFYQYAKGKDGYPTQSWTEWKKQHGIK